MYPASPSTPHDVPESHSPKRSADLRTPQFFRIDRNDQIGAGVPWIDRTPLVNAVRSCLVTSTLAIAMQAAMATPPALEAADVAASAVSERSHAPHNAPIENGLPCLRDVCVGDALEDLHHIPWQPATSPVDGRPLAHTSVSNRYLEQLGDSLRASPQALRSVAPFWFLRQIDDDGIRALEQVEAVCQPFSVAQRLRGEYASANGERTQVSFEPVASEDGREQRFVVSTITRYYPPSLGAEQLERIGQEFAQRYAGLDTYPRTDRPGVRWLAHGTDGDATLKLFAPIGDVRQRAIDLTKHPACHGR